MLSNALENRKDDQLALSLFNQTCFFSLAMIGRCPELKELKNQVNADTHRNQPLFRLALSSHSPGQQLDERTCQDETDDLDPMTPLS